VAIQTGNLLGVTVNQPGTNTARMNYNGTGNVQVKWNGGHLHSFSGVNTVDIHAQGGRRNKLTFSLTGPAGPALALFAAATGHAGTASVAEGAARHLRVQSSTLPKNHGGAVQSGTVLTVDVDDAKGNSVQLSDSGRGNIGVAWNGGPAHSFTGITMIVVHANRARNDQVIFTGPIV
jgi:hypothetical protein